MLSLFVFLFQASSMAYHECQRNYYHQMTDSQVYRLEFYVFEKCNFRSQNSDERSVMCCSKNINTSDSVGVYLFCKCRRKLDRVIHL